MNRKFAKNLQVSSIAVKILLRTSNRLAVIYPFVIEQFYKLYVEEKYCCKNLIKLLFLKSKCFDHYFVKDHYNSKHLL